MTLSKQERQARLLLDRLASQIEAWVSDESDSLFGLPVMIERDERGKFFTMHVRCQRSLIEKKPVKKRSEKTTA